MPKSSMAAQLRSTYERTLAKEVGGEDRPSLDFGEAPPLGECTCVRACVRVRVCVCMCVRRALAYSLFHTLALWTSITDQAFAEQMTFFESYLFRRIHVLEWVCLPREREERAENIW